MKKNCKTLLNGLDSEYEAEKSLKQTLKDDATSYATLKRFHRQLEDTFGAKINPTRIKSKFKKTMSDVEPEKSIESHAFTQMSPSKNGFRNPSYLQR